MALTEDPGEQRLRSSSAFSRGPGNVSPLARPAISISTRLEVFLGSSATQNSASEVIVAQPRVAAYPYIFEICAS
jgi:hypothetical protein